LHTAYRTLRCAHEGTDRIGLWQESAAETSQPVCLCGWERILCRGHHDRQCPQGAILPDCPEHTKPGIACLSRCKSSGNTSGRTSCRKARTPLCVENVSTAYSSSPVYPVIDRAGMRDGPAQRAPIAPCHHGSGNRRLDQSCHRSPAAIRPPAATRSPRHPATGGPVDSLPMISAPHARLRMPRPDRVFPRRGTDPGDTRARLSPLSYFVPF
jgi:hypothetical protein